MRCCSSDKAWEGQDSGVRLAVHLQNGAPASKSATRKYLQTGSIGERLAGITAKLLEAQPEDPYKFLIDELSEVTLKKNSSVTSAGRVSTASTNIGNLLDLPLVVSNGHAKITEFGPNHCIFSLYSMHRDGHLHMSIKRREASFFESFVDGWRLESFCEALIDAFHLKKATDIAVASHVDLEESQTIYVANNDPNTRDEHHHGRAQDFLIAAEQLLVTKEYHSRLRLFAPSQLLIFKLELFATEWLAAHSDILHTMPQSVTFAGIISSHNFTSNMAMSASGQVPSMQLWTLPIGGLVPLAEGIFSTPTVQDHEQVLWRNRIRTELRKANYAIGVHGLWVGTNGTYDCIKEVGCTDMVLSKAVTLGKLEKALERCDPTNLKFLGNLILLQEVIKATFSENAWFLFKSSWRLDGYSEDVEMNWPLGLFTQQLTTRAKKATATHAAVEARLKPGHIRLLSPWNMPAGAFFEVPYIAWPTGAALILDFGTGETGVYRFEPNIRDSTLQLVHEAKLQSPLYEGWVAKSQVSDAAKTIMKEFRLQELVDKQGWRRVLLVGGATGAHRAMLTEKSDVRESVIVFLRKVEEAMSVGLGVSVCIRMFIPSGEFEAELELRSVEYLMGQPDLVLKDNSVTDWMFDRCFQIMASDMVSRRSQVGIGEETISKEIARHRLQSLGVPNGVVAGLDNENLLDRFSVADLKEAAMTDKPLQALTRSCSFCGTISAGGGSCQLALAGLTRESMVQMYSMSAGNRTPVESGLFPKKGEITEEKRQEWVQMVRGLISGAFPPQKVKGFFVGISAVYHAAKAANVADRFVNKAEAVLAFAKCLTSLPNDDIRSIANITLVKEMIECIFDDENSSFLFKRNWKVGNCTYVAGWTLGLYSSQFDADHELRHAAACQVQRCVRGWSARRGIV